jgi:AcrR family transcriptional regulator
MSRATSLGKVRKTALECKLMKSRREANMEATRAALLAVARKHFAREGFSGAEIGRIAKDARVTTGAVYHHFAGKKELFQAVAEELETEILAAAANIEDPDPLQRLRLGFEKLIDVCARPDVQRITFVEAPQVIGPEAWRKIELRYAYGATRTALETLRAQGIIKPFPPELVTRMLLALLRETSAEIARAKRAPDVRDEISALVTDVFDALLVKRA